MVPVSARASHTTTLIALTVAQVAQTARPPCRYRSPPERRTAGLAVLLGRDAKGAISPLIYMTGIGLSFVAPWAGMLCYFAVALMWVVPDRRIEKMAERG